MRAPLRGGTPVYASPHMCAAFTLIHTRGNKEAAFVETMEKLREKLRAKDGEIERLRSGAREPLRRAKPSVEREEEEEEEGEETIDGEGWGGGAVEEQKDGESEGMRKLRRMVAEAEGKAARANAKVEQLQREIAELRATD